MKRLDEESVRAEWKNGPDAWSNLLTKKELGG
jgi:hypothetical protein